MKILFIGDVIGEPGRKTVARQVPRLVRERGVDCVIANAENAAGGFGVTPDVARELFAAGVHVLTSGNHIWDKKEIIDYIKDEPRLLRPANYPKGVPGFGSVVVTTAAGEKVGVVQVMGRVSMPTVDCPFRVVRHEVEAVKQEARTVIVDMHAEATSEKMAMGWYLDGEVSGVFGTHTHVQTADERILPKGTAYLRRRHGRADRVRDRDQEGNRHREVPLPDAAPLRSGPGPMRLFGGAARRGHDGRQGPLDRTPADNGLIA